MLITREKSQLLIVDVQDKLLDAISGKDRVVERCVRLVRAARMLGVPITLSEQYPQGLGPTADPIREAFANAGFVVDKVEFSCLRSEPLRARVSRKLAITRLLKAGADVVDSEMVLFEWLERAGTPEFKELQALIK